MTSGVDPGSSDRWMERRLPAWQQLDRRLPELEDDKPVPAGTALDALRQYPEIARDLAIIQHRAPGSRTAAYLGHTYARLHRVLFKPSRPPARERLDAFRSELPTVVAELRWYIAAVALLFALAALAGWWLIASFPELISLVASEQMIDTVQQGGLWTDDLLNVTPSSVLSIRIFTNNIVVALMAFCLGLLFGLGTIYIIGLNGLMLGGVFAFTAQHGLALRLFEFVCAHGFVELSVICIAGAVGCYVGESIVRPGHRTRVQALQRSVAHTSSVMVLCVLYLLGAGLIEGYVSPHPGYPFGVRLTVGVAYWLLLLFGLAGFRVPALRPGAARAAAGTATAPGHPATPAS